MDVWRRQWVAGVLAAALLLAVGCSDEPNGEGGDTGSNAGADAADGMSDDGGLDTTGGEEPDTEAPADTAPSTDVPTVADDPNCDPLNTTYCALPWPSSKFLEKDSERTTGYTLAFGDQTLPANKTGAAVDPKPYRRLDGFSVGQPIMVAFENLDASGMPNESAIEKSVEKDAQILLYEVDGNSLERVPYWTELDAKAEKDAELKMLIVRPAVVLKEDTRYIVAFRNLKRTDGSTIESSTAFELLRDGETRQGSLLAERQSRFDEIFTMLEGEGVSRDSLTVAWDFHTASSDALHGRMLHMRKRGFEIVGEDGPEITIEEVKQHVPQSNGGSMPVDAHKALEIKGTFRVPRFMKEVLIEGSRHWVFNLGKDGMPKQNGWKEEPFWMVIPHSAINKNPKGTATGNGKQHGFVQYGHGLLGKGSLTDRDYNREIANTYDLIFFGASLTGMKEEDTQAAIAGVSNFSKFPFLADRLHQGLLEYLLLARGIRERLEDTKVAKDYGIKVNKNELFYSGISQGGIFGQTFMALSTDTTRGHLGVPGNNYSTLLDRSKSFGRFFTIMKLHYPNRLDQLLGIATIQLLWSQTDPVSYVRHIRAETFPNTPQHDIILAPAKGDHLVAPITNEVVARSEVGIKLMSNYPRDVALVQKESFPHEGSGIVLYDFGNPWAKPGNRPPEGKVEDPHEKPRHEAWHNEQMVHFFRTGEIINTCNKDGNPVCDPK